MDRTPSVETIIASTSVSGKVGTGQLRCPANSDNSSNNTSRRSPGVTAVDEDISPSSQRGTTILAAPNRQRLAHPVAASVMSTAGVVTLATMTTRWSPQRLGNLDGKRIIVTGATNGVGLATARALARAGAQVILAVRNLELGAQRHQIIGTSVVQSSFGGGPP